MTLVDQWLDYLATTRAMSPHTVATYARTLRTLPNPETATREDVEAWWESRKHLAASSRNNELSAVRAFYAWCRRFEHRGPTDDPTHRIDPPKQPKGQPHPMSRHDLHVLFEKLPEDLMRAVALGAYGGLRVAEAAVLDWHDVDRELNRMRVRGKGGKERLVGMSALLLDYLLPDTGGNVVTGGGKPYTGQTLQRRVNRAIRAALEQELPEGAVCPTFHALRHRFGTMAVAGGAPLLSVSRAMGHATPATTAIYVAASDSDLDLIAEAVTR